MKGSLCHDAESRPSKTGESFLVIKMAIDLFTLFTCSGQVDQYSDRFLYVRHIIDSNSWSQSLNRRAMIPINVKLIKK